MDPVMLAYFTAILGVFSIVVILSVVRIVEFIKKVRGVT